MVRAPPEILCTIASYFSEEDLFSASQVCHHWRSALISSPSLWTQISCRHVPQTVTSLERCKSLPIQLRLESQFSTVALNDVVLHGNELASLAMRCNPDGIPPLRKLLASSGPSMERLHISPEEYINEHQTGHGIWQNFPSLRELLIRKFRIPDGWSSSPNLVHLALEDTRGTQEVTVRSILGVLRGCPLLETLLLVNSVGYLDLTHDPSPVSLPNLRSIELGSLEVHCGLTVCLRFPRNAAVGFRGLSVADESQEILPVVMAAMLHVLRRVDIRRITYVTPSSRCYQRKVSLLIRFEGLRGSLEITATPDHRLAESRLKALLSPSLPIENTRELHMIYWYFDSPERSPDGRAWSRINVTMPNLVSISFSRCHGTCMFGPLTPTDPSSPPFPHLERVMVLGGGKGLREMVKARKDYGVPLKTVVAGRKPRGLLHSIRDGFAGSDRYMGDHPEDCAGVGEFVDDLYVGCPTEAVEWGAGNEIMNVYSSVGAPAVSPN
jgi:hypothetical protein